VTAQVEIMWPEPLHRVEYFVAIFTRRGNAIRMISARRAGKQEAKLYGQKEKCLLT